MTPQEQADSVLMADNQQFQQALAMASNISQTPSQPMMDQSQQMQPDMQGMNGQAPAQPMPQGGMQ
jgi:hypothetical protein